MTWDTGHGTCIRIVTHTRYGMGHGEHGLCDAGQGTWGHGAQGIVLELQQWAQRAPFHVSAWGPRMQWKNPIFPFWKNPKSYKHPYMFFLLLPVSDAKECVSTKALGPRVYPTIPPAAMELKACGQGHG